MACANLIDFIPPLYIVTAFYVIALASNIITSIRWLRAEPQNIFARAAVAGFILFACCDIFAGISYLARIELLPQHTFYAMANFMSWFFYYPSQILVSNSSKCATIEEKEGKS